MTKDQTFEEKVKRLLKLGLRNRWYCLGPSPMFQDRPIALTRLGDSLVAWRDGDGLVNVVENRCPHRGAPLSSGRMVDGRLTCRYHGVQVGGDGRVLSVPAFPGCDLVGQQLIKSYPTVEHFQAVWAYFGDEKHPEPVPFEPPEAMVSAEWTGFVVSNTWHTNYRYIYDNLVDIMHPPFLHGETYYMAHGDRADEVEIDPTEFGFRVRRTGDPDSNVEAMEFTDRGGIWFRVDIHSPPGVGPGRSMRIIPLATPIDEHSSQINIWRMKKLDGWQADMFRFMFNTRLEPLNWEIIEQDRELLEEFPDWPPIENLYQHDLGPSRLRRHFQREAEAQIRTLEEAS